MCFCSIPGSAQLLECYLLVRYAVLTHEDILFLANSVRRASTNNGSRVKARISWSSDRILHCRFAIGL